MIRIHLGVVLGAAILVGQPVAAHAAKIGAQCECADQVAPSVLAAFDAYPDGGVELAMLIRDLVTANPELAADVICEARNRSLGAKTSAAAGLVRAQVMLVSSAPQRARELALLASCADEEFRAAFLAVQSSSEDGSGAGGPPPILLPGGFGRGFGGGAANSPTSPN